MPYLIRLGAFGEGTLRQQTQFRLAYVEQAKLDWWRKAKLGTALKQALRHFEEERTPGSLLLSALNEALKRIAKRWPYVEWSQGGKDQLMGFWPDRRAMAHGENEQRLFPLCAYALKPRPPAGFYINQQTIHHRQKYWCIYDRRQFGIYTLFGRPFWLVQGTWTQRDEANLAMLNRERQWDAERQASLPDHVESQPYTEVYTRMDWDNPYRHSTRSIRSRR